MPEWIPDDNFIKTTNIARLQNRLGIKTYKELFNWSVTHRKEFWELMLEIIGIKLRKSYNEIVKFNSKLQEPEWLYGAEMNIAESCFKSDPSAIAILFQPANGKPGKLTYGELGQLSNRVANGLLKIDVKKGDTVAVDMVMTAEAVAIYLGIIKAGCAVVSIADSLTPAEITKRLSIANSKIVFTQDVIVRGDKIIPLYQRVIASFADKIIVLPGSAAEVSGLRDKDISWKDFLSENTEFQPVSCKPSDTCNILFSSGTTGDPKAIPWTHVTPVKCAADGYLHHNIKEKEVIAWHTNIGWMMGPWLIFATLINKATIALFYGAPTGKEFGEFVQNAGVNMLGVVPSMVKQWKETNCMQGIDWSSISRFSSTGEVSNPADYSWLMTLAGNKPIIEYCGGTEIGGGYVTSTMVQPNIPSTFSTPALGLDFLILDEEKNPAAKGEVFIIPPSIGLSNFLLNKDHHEIYYKSAPALPHNAKGISGITAIAQVSSLKVAAILRNHGDEIEILPNGYMRALGRADDTMNLGGIKVGTAEIEGSLQSVAEVRETAAIAINPKEGGPSRLVIYVVLKAGASITSDKLKDIFQANIKKTLNPLFKVSDVAIVEQIPRTASNKIMRRELRDGYATTEKAG